MNVLSLFDGISGTQVALDRNGVKVDKYHASEIDKFPISITQKNYPNTNQLGSVTDWQDWDIDWSSIDLVVGGFPCQAWSNAGLKQGDKDPRGMLFWTMLDVIKKVLANNPQAKFLMENVRMKKEFEEYITFHTQEALGKVNKHLINSALVSAQNRKRFYWTNIDGIEQPEDQGLVLSDILMNPGQLVFDRPCELKDFDPKSDCHHVANATDIKGNESIKRVYADSGKSPTLTTMGGGHREPKVLIIPQQVRVRKYEVDIVNLQQTLRDHKSMTILTNKNLADLLYIPVTKVEHWFRTDSSFAIPSEDIWFRLKALLVIETDKFDKSIVCFEVRDGKFDMAERVYSPEGKSPTVVASNVAKVMDQPTYRKLRPCECEALQTFPIGYTEGISNSQRYKCLGNSFTVSVVSHILSYAF